jgi:hypothetical protein
MMLVYVSSTVEDLRAYRELVVDALRHRRHVVLGAASFAASEQRSRSQSLTAVANSMRYVGIIGWRYGFIPTDDNPDGLSITELEFREAGRLRRPRIVFMAVEGSPLRSAGDDDPTAIHLFRDRVSREPGVKVVEFKDGAELRHQLGVGLDWPTHVDDPPPPQAPEVRDPLRVFISYSRRDNRWRERVEVHLKALQHQLQVDPWSDEKIRPGDRWLSEIERELASAGVAVLVVSADFLASSFIRDVELPKLLEAAAGGGCRILTLVVGPCRIADHPELGHYQAVNPLNRPLSEMPEGEQEAALDNLAKEVSRHIAAQR